MKSEEFEKLDGLVKTKNYTDLTSEEKDWVDEALGRPGYEELYQLVSGVSEEHTRNTSSRVKADLVRHMKRKNRGVLESLLTYKTPIYANALALLLLAVVIWIVRPAREVIVEKPVTITVPVVDTVTVQLPPDTILIEREVRVEVPIYLTRTDPPKEEPKQPKAKSFGEDQALQDLLVSGR